jgi:hypothetical protein
MPKSLHNILCQTQRSHGKRIYTPKPAGLARIHRGGGMGVVPGHNFKADLALQQMAAFEGLHRFARKLALLGNAVMSTISACKSVVDPSERMTGV